MYRATEEKKPKDDFIADEQQFKIAEFEEYVFEIFKFVQKDLNIQAILVFAESQSDGLKAEIKSYDLQNIKKVIRALYNSWLFILTTQLQLILDGNLELELHIAHDFLNDYHFKKICKLLHNKIDECIDAAWKEYNNNAEPTKELSTFLQKSLLPAFKEKNTFEDILKLSLNHDSNRIFKGIDTEEFNKAFTYIQRYFTRYALSKTLTKSTVEFRDVEYFLTRLSTLYDIQILLQSVLDQNYKEYSLFHLICEKTNSTITSIAVKLLESKKLVALLPMPPATWNPVALTEKLFAAAKKGDVESIKLCVELGVNIYRTTKTTNKNALLYAAENGKREAVSYLMSQGLMSSETDATGKSLLLTAVMNPENDIRFIKYLLDELELDPTNEDTIDNMKRNALHLAVLHSNDEVVKLLRFRIPINSQDIDGNTPLHLAITHNKLEKIIILIFEREAKISQRNADLFIKNEKGKSPIDLIKEKDNLQLNEILVSVLKMEIKINYENIVNQANKIRVLNKKSLKKESKNNQTETSKWHFFHFKSSSLASPITSLDSTINFLIESIVKNDLKNGSIYLADILKYPKILLDEVSKYSNHQKYQDYCIFHVICEVIIASWASDALNAIIINNLFSSLVAISRPKNWNPRGLEIKFFDSAKKGDLKTIEYCVELGINIDSKNKPVISVSERSVKPISGKNALHYAAENGQKNTVQYFIVKGLSLFEKDPSGKNILLLAVQGESNNKSSYTSFIEYLLFNLALDPNDTDENKRNALHLAVIGNAYPTIKLLCQYGVDVNHKDYKGNTPLHYALEKEDSLELIKLLLDWGACANITNKEGETPKGLAKKKKIKEFKELFTSVMEPKEETAKQIKILELKITAFRQIIEQQKQEFKEKSHSKITKKYEKEEKEERDEGRKKLIIGHGRSNASLATELDDKKFNIIQEEDKIYITLKFSKKNQAILFDPILNDLSNFLRRTIALHEGFEPITNGNGFCVKIKNENQDKLINMLGQLNSLNIDNSRSLSFS